MHDCAQEQITCAEAFEEQFQDTAERNRSLKSLYAAENAAIDVDDEDDDGV